jgi:hypothetical protein
MVSPIRCPACGNENPPEYPPEQFAFCMECGAQLGAFRPQGQQDPYGHNPNDQYGGQHGGGHPGGPPGPPPGQYGQQSPGPYGGGQQGGYGGGPADPYGGQGGYGNQQHGGPHQGGPPPQGGPGAPYGAPQGGYGGAQPGYGGPQRGYGAPEPAPYQSQAPGPASAKLILESGVGKVEYPLDAGVVTIGRSRSNDISLEDARVSRHHARVVRGDRGYMIEDLNSRNGTRVDERAIRDSVPLSEGSIVKIGDAVFRFTASAGGPAGPGASGGPGGYQSSPGPQPGPNPWDAPAQHGGPPAGQYGHGGGHGGPQGGQYGPGGMGGPQPGPQVPVLFMSPWSPVQCPQCQGLRTMVQIVFGPAAQSPGAQTAARRGEVIIGDGPALPDGPNAECRACGTRVRIVQSGS